MAGDITTLDRSPAPDRPAARIDPRFRARRIAVRRDAGRRRLQRLVDLGVLAAVAAGFVLALRSPLLDVDRVEVRGGSHVEPAEIRRVAEVSPGTQLMDLDLGRIGARVAALAWVDEVAVSRRLDGTVSLSITERVPVARLEPVGSAPVLVDGTGRVLGPGRAGEADGLVTVTGLRGGVAPGASLGPDARGALRTARAVAARAPGALSRLRVERDGQLVGELRQGGTVRFGDARDLDAKILSLVTVLDQVDLTDLAELDLRLPGNPVVTRVP